MTIEDFRASFPHFTEDIAPDARVRFFLALAEKQLPPERWGDLLDDGIALLTAHNLSLEAEIVKDKTGAGAIAAAAGPVTSESKTVGSMSKSVSRSGAAGQGTSLAGAGNYNATIYGQQFWQLAQIVGAGGIVA